MKEEKTKKKFNKKLLTFGVLSIFALALVTAGILTYYGLMHQEITVEQAVLVDGQIGFEVTEATINGVSGQKFYSSEHYLTNNHPDDRIIIDFESTIVYPDDEGGLTIRPSFKLDATIDDDAFT